MAEHVLSDEAAGAIETLEQVDIVVGVPTYNNVRTIEHVLRAIHAGLVRFFPQFTSLIINSDCGSTDGTRNRVACAGVGDLPVVVVTTPLRGVHRVSFPYHGMPGKGSAFRLIFQTANRLNAKVCAIVDADLSSITPEWIDLLVRPVLHSGFDFVAPSYHRHKYDGTITNSVVYPMTRTLYGKKIRQPVGGDFGLSPQLFSRYLERDDWETHVVRFATDVWMTTIAVAEGFRVCQSFLGVKSHGAWNRASGLSDMLQQVVGSVFSLMGEYEPAWMRIEGSEPADLFGFRYDAGMDPVSVNVERMIEVFRRGCGELGEIWEAVLSAGTFHSVQAISRNRPAPASAFHIDDDLWVRIIYDLAVSHHRHPISRTHLLGSFRPLYIGRVASFVNETREMNADEVEDRIEQLCLSFEHQKPYLIQRWSHRTAARESTASATPRIPVEA